MNDKGELRYKSRKDQALIEIYNKLRPGEPPSVDSATSLLNALFFDPKRYDLAHVGRYKYNKKLALAGRVAGMTLAEEVKNPYTGEILAEAGEVLSRDAAERAQNAGVNEIVVQVEGREMRVIGNNFAYLKPFLADYDPELYAQYDESVRQLYRARARAHAGGTCLTACARTACRSTRRSRRPRTSSCPSTCW